MIKNWRPARVNVFAVVETLLTVASLVLVAITMGGQLGAMLGLDGGFGEAVAWVTALIFDALWIGALRMSGIAIRQRSVLGMVVMLSLAGLAVAGSIAVLLAMGHLKVFAFAPLAAAVFMGLRLFADHVLADPETAARIAAASAADRAARAEADSAARQLKAQAEREVVEETAEHCAEAQRQIARVKTLTRTQKALDKARADAEGRLAQSEKKHGKGAAAHAARSLRRQHIEPPALAPLEPVAPAMPAVAVDAEGATESVALPALDDTTLAEVAAAMALPVAPDTAGGTEGATVSTSDDAVEDVPAALAVAAGVAGATESVALPVVDGTTLEEVATVAGVAVPATDSPLSDAQVVVVLRWLRHSSTPPLSGRQAMKAFWAAGYCAGEARLRRAWATVQTSEEPSEA